MFPADSLGTRSSGLPTATGMSTYVALNMQEHRDPGPVAQRSLWESVLSALLRSTSLRSRGWMAAEANGRGDACPAWPKDRSCHGCTSRLGGGTRVAQLNQTCLRCSFALRISASRMAWATAKLFSVRLSVKMVVAGETLAV